jgi:hypothetical protein
VAIAGAPAALHAKPAFQHKETTVTEEMERYVSLAHGVAAHATAGTLHPDTAMRFCRAILPSLMVEFDIARRIEARLEQMFPATAAVVAAPPAPCEATVCSSRWQGVSEKKAKRAKKKAAKKVRRKKGECDDLPS